MHKPVSNKEAYMFDLYYNNSCTIRRTHSARFNSLAVMNFQISKVENALCSVSVHLCLI